MRARKYLICAEWLNNLMIVLLYYIVAEWVYCALNIRVSPFYVMILAAVIVSAYFIRVYISRLPLYILAHMLMWGLMVFMPVHIAYKTTGIVALVIMTVCDLIFWTEDGIRSFNIIHPAAVTVIIAVFIYGSINGQTMLVKESYIAGICFAAVFFIRTYLMNAVKFAMDMQVGDQTPLQDIFRNNGRMVFALVLSFTLLMFLVHADSLAAGIRAMVGMIAAVVRKIMIFMLSLLPKGSAQEALEGEAVNELHDLGAYKAFPVWVITLVETLEKVIVILLILMIAYFIIKAVAAFFRMYFYRRGYQISMTERESYTDIEEWISHKGYRRKRKTYGAYDERDRIRKKYKKEVEELRRGGYALKLFHTPKERAKDVLEDFDDVKNTDFLRLTEKYEEFRYGR